MVVKLFRLGLRDSRFRFLIGGGFAAFVNWAVRFPLNLVMPFGAAVFVSAVIGMAVGFVVYRHFVFAGSVRPIWLQVRDFLIVNGIGTVVMIAASILAKAALLFILAHEGLAAAAAHAFGIAVGAVANYIGHKRLTFRV